MKGIISALLLSLGIAANAAAPGPAVVSGVWDRGDARQITLYGVADGKVAPIISYHLPEDRTFWFAFNAPDEGFYALGTGLAEDKKNKYVFYIKPGDTLGIAVDDAACGFTVQPTPENEALARWHAALGAGERTESQPTANVRFEREFARYRTFTLPAGEADMQLLTSDDALMRYPFGMQILEQRLAEAGASLDDRLAVVSDRVLKGEVVLMAAARLSTITGINDLTERHGNLLTLPAQRHRMGAIRTRIEKSENMLRQKTVDISGVDARDKRISLSDLKGKVVLVDIWATWCAPCIAELPHIKKLMAEYADGDIVLLGVSIDEARDKAKWLEFMRENGEHGIQIFAGQGWNSDIVRDYNVKAIPRFMLFDRSGNAISTFAPRPSSPELKLLIDKALAK